MISIVMLVKNAQRKLEEVLSSLGQFPEIVLIDTGSTDETIAIAKRFTNVRIFEKEFTGFGELRNYGASLATYDWLLSLDGDEVLSPALQQEILSLTLKDTCIYALPFHNYFNQKHIRTAGWHPERHIRLYNRKRTCFSEAKVHEGIQRNNLEEVCLSNPVLHYPYGDVADFLTKMQHYSELFALQNKGKRHSSPMIALCHGLWAFFKSYFIKLGIFGGYEGLLISLYNGHTAFYKYVKLYHLNKRISC